MWRPSIFAPAVAAVATRPTAADPATVVLLVVAVMVAPEVVAIAARHAVAMVAEIADVVWLEGIPTTRHWRVSKGGPVVVRRLASSSLDPVSRLSVG